MASETGAAASGAETGAAGTAGNKRNLETGDLENSDITGEPDDNVDSDDF